MRFLLEEGKIIGLYTPRNFQRNWNLYSESTKENKNFLCLLLQMKATLELLFKLNFACMMKFQPNYFIHSKRHCENMRVK